MGCPNMSYTIKDVAAVAGVSYGTVSRVLNDRPGVNAQTREKVLHAMKQLGYQPNAIARNLVRQKSNSIALVVPDISSPFFGNLTLAVNERAIDAGYNVMLYNSNFDLKLEKRILRFIREQRVDGLIIKPTKENSSQFAEFNIPTVLVSHVYSGDTAYVDVQNKEGGYLAGKHLAECGYQNPAFIGGFAEASSTKLRLEGFRQALNEHKITLQEQNLYFGKYSIAHGYETMGQILKNGKHPDAVFCGNDQIALGVMERADEEQINIPNNLGIIGFDDVLIPSLPRIQITTIAQPIEQIGDTAFQLLVDMLRDGNRNAIEKIDLPPRLVARSTTKKL